MRSKTWISGLALIVLLTIFSGYMQGTLQRRWGFSAAERMAAARMAEFPKVLGEWQTISELELSETSIKMLEPSAYHVRVVKSPESPFPVIQILLLGPSGYIGAHTPEVCVSGSGYEQLGETERTTVPHPDNPDLDGTFWIATFRSRGSDRHLLRTYWAWSTGGPWEAATGSRTRYGLFPYLYKIQLECRLPAGSDPDAADPVLDLLGLLVAESPNYLLAADEAEAMAASGSQPISADPQ